MKFMRVLKRAIHLAMPPLIFLAIAGYFSWNATQGEHGTLAYKKKLILLEQAQQTQKDALSEQQIWIHRVNGLHEKSLDTDMLDERARSMLNLGDKNDIIIPYDRHSPLF